MQLGNLKSAYPIGYYHQSFTFFIIPLYAFIFASDIAVALYD